MHQSLIEKMFSNIFGILKPPKEINGNVVDNYIRWSDDFLDVKVYSKLTEAQVRSLVGLMIILVEITAKGFNGGEQINTQSDPQRYIKATFVNKMIDAFFRNFGNRQMNAGVNIEQYQLLKNKFTYLSNKLKAHP